jgi:hypothetical protein
MQKGLWLANKVLKLQLLPHQTIKWSDQVWTELWGVKAWSIVGDFVGWSFAVRNFWRVTVCWALSHAQYEWEELYAQSRRSIKEDIQQDLVQGGSEKEYYIGLLLRVDNAASLCLCWWILPWAYSHLSVDLMSNTELLATGSWSWDSSDLNLLLILRLDKQQYQACMAQTSVWLWYKSTGSM